MRSLPGFEPLAGMCPLLAVQQPTLIAEVLPEAAQPGTLLSSLTMEAGHQMHVPPECGRDRHPGIVHVRRAAGPRFPHASKDMVLSVGALPA